MADPLRNIGILLIPDFPMMGFSAAVEPLRSANYISEESLFQWYFYTPDNAPSAASNGILVNPSREFEEYRDLDCLFVCSGFGAADYHNPLIDKWLRRVSADGIRIGGITTGTYLLARAGLLNGYRCTIHWESLPAFCEQYPAIRATRSLYEVDRDRFTCSGGTAAMDLMLFLITRDHGPDLALDVAAQFQHDRVRTSRDKQRHARISAAVLQSPRLAAAIKLMTENLETPLTPAEISDAVGLSTRQLERLFHKYCQSTPQRFYLNLRLQHARRLLLETGMSILNASIASGFASQSHFTKCYRDRYGRTPKQERMQFTTTI